MKVNLSNYPAYSVDELIENKEFSFVTDHNIEYLVYFAEADGYAPSASFVEELSMFGFGPVASTRTEGKLPTDGRVITTIFEILFYYTSKFPDAILLYVCSDESIWKPGQKDWRYGKWRNEAFSDWFQAWQETKLFPAEKIDYCLFGQTYCSCIFKTGNPYESEVREVIEQTKLSKLP